MGVQESTESKVDGRSLRAERVRQDNKAHILKAASELLSANRGSAITVRMIAERANVSIATVYNHFPGSTAEIYIEVGNRLVDSAADATKRVLER